MQTSDPTEAFPIILADYRDSDRKFRLVDSELRGASSDRHPSSDNMGGARGFAAFVRLVKLTRPRRVGIALYELDDHLWLRIGFQLFDVLVPPLLQVQARPTGIPLLRRATLSRGGKPLMSFQYFGESEGSWPERDIVRYLERSTASVLRAIETKLFWKANAAGLDVLDEQILARLKSSAEEETRRMRPD